MTSYHGVVDRAQVKPGDTAPWMSAAGSHSSQSRGAYACCGDRRPHDSVKTAGDQTASPGNSPMLHVVLVTGPIQCIPGGILPVAVIGGPTIATKPSIRRRARRSFVWTKRPLSRPWIAPTRCWRSRPDLPSATASYTIATARRPALGAAGATPSDRGI